MVYGTYKYNRDLKNDIIEVARKLFFEKGYNSTTFADLAKYLDTSKGHINYYYSTKEEIGSIIYNEYTNNIKKLVKEKMTDKYGGFDIVTATAVEFRLTNLMYKTYPSTAKFYEEMVGKLFTNVSQRGPEKIIAVAKQYNLDWVNDTDRLSFVSYAWNGAVASVIIQYFNGNIPLRYEEFDDMRVALPFQIAQMSQKRIDKIVKESKTVFNELDFQILPYFKVV